MRSSTLVVKTTPSFSATALASSIMVRPVSRVPGSLHRRPSVDPVSTLSGLKARLPHSFTQIACRMSVVFAGWKPACPNSVTIRSTAGLSRPATSPKTKRWSLTWRSRQGPSPSTATKVVAPTTRSGSMERHSSPSGSMLASGRSAKGSGWRCGYHQGMPLTIGTMAVSGPSSGVSVSMVPRSAWALTQRNTRSWGPNDRLSSVTRGFRRATRFSGVTMVRPLRRMAAAEFGRATNVTSASVAPSRAVSRPPTAPAPMMATFIQCAPARAVCRSSGICQPLPGMASSRLRV